MTQTLTAAQYRKRSTEAGMTDALGELVGYLGGRMWHVRDSRQSPETEDMPDLLIIVPGLVAVVELKSQRRQTTFGQTLVRELMHTIPDCPCVLAWHVRPEPNRVVGEKSFDQLFERLNASREEVLG